MHKKLDLNKIQLICDALNTKYPEGNNPFKIMTRMAEEVGELAKEVNHVEGSKAKIEKFGVGDKTRIADEAKDVIHVVLQLIRYYNLEADLNILTDQSIKKYKDEGLIK